MIVLLRAHLLPRSTHTSPNHWVSSSLILPAKSFAMIGVEIPALNTNHQRSELVRN